MFEVGFTLTYASNTITAFGGGETSVLDALRIIILLEKDLSMQEIASASLLEDTVEISMEEVCWDGYALVMSDISRACVPCGPGWRYDNGAKECVLCDYGHYQNSIAQTECKPCGDDKWTNFRGAREENDCIIKCPVGQDLKAGTNCASCERGFFNNNVDLNKFNACQECSTGKTTETTGSTSESDCSIPVCSKGEYIKDDVCTDCPQDQFSDEELPNSGTTCLSCTASDLAIAGPDDGTYGTENTGSSSSDCKPFCPSGYIINAESTGCKPCPRGSYKINEEGRFAAECTGCQVGTTTERMASTHVDNCSIPACNAGQYILNGACTSCPIDTFSTEELPTSETGCLNCTGECDLCEIRGTEGRGASRVEECRAYCPSGRVINAVLNDCIPCPIGMYKDNTLDMFSSECTPCPDGSATQNVGATQASQCTSQEEQSSLAVIIGSSVAGGLLLMVVVSFLIYRRRKRNEKLPEEGRSDRTDTSNPMNVYDLPQDGENDIPTRKNEYDVIPADVNVYMTVTEDAQTSTGTNESSIHAQNTDTTTSERNIYSELDVKSLNDKDKDYLRLYTHDSHGYLAPIQLGNISHNRNEEGRNSTSFL